MLDNSVIIKVTNRNRGTIGYDIPDLGNLHRSYAPGETKEITMEELRKLSYVPGGQVMIEDNLIIQNDEAITELIGKVEPEYYYTKADIEEILIYGTVEQLMDLLDFAPKGTIDIIKQVAVDKEIYDTRKIQVIKNKTGFDVSKAIEINKESKEEGTEEEHRTTRRAEPLKTHSPEPAPKYKVVKEPK